MKRSRIVVLVAALIAGLARARPAAAGQPKPKKPKLNPVIFVHGFVGSGAQFESQQQRFTSNGYPQRLIAALDYDSTFGLATREQVYAQLDALIARMQRRSGRPKVDLLGHSLGTSLMQEYLATPERAARVAHYVNLDGRTATAPPGRRPDAGGLGGRRHARQDDHGRDERDDPEPDARPGGHLGGDVRRDLPLLPRAPARDHQDRPEARQVREARRPRRALPAERRRDERDAPDRGRSSRATGRRVGRAAATKQLTGDGSWGPFKLERGAHYEFAITRPESGTHHLYYEPFRRADHLVRLLTAEPNAGLDALTTKGEGHAVVIVTRNKELWGDQGAQNDVLSINGTNVINAATSPQSKRTIGLFAFDSGADGQSNLSAPLPAFFALPFISGVDLAIPAARPPTGRISVRLRSRGRGPVRAINFPNFPSATDRVSVQFNDYE